MTTNLVTTKHVLRRIGRLGKVGSATRKLAPLSVVQ